MGARFSAIAPRSPRRHRARCARYTRGGGGGGAGGNVIRRTLLKDSFPVALSLSSGPSQRPSAISRFGGVRLFTCVRVGRDSRSYR